MFAMMDHVRGMVSSHVKHAIVNYQTNERLQDFVDYVQRTVRCCCFFLICRPVFHWYVTQYVLEVVLYLGRWKCHFKYNIPQQYRIYIQVDEQLLFLECTGFVTKKARSSVYCTGYVKLNKMDITYSVTWMHFITSCAQLFFLFFWQVMHL